MSSNKLITPAQIKELHILLASTGLMAYKQDMMDEVCIDGRYPTSSKELYDVEAAAIITALKAKNDQCDTMRKKVISYAMQAGMAINGRADMPKIYNWVVQYGHATDAKGNKKPFNKYSYKELTTLIIQAENMFKSYLKAIQNEK